MSENSQKVAIYPGSFNPLHIGHLDILHQGLQVFDKIILLHAINPEKIKVFPNIQKWEMEEIIDHQLTYFGKDKSRIEYDETSGPIFKYCEEHDIHHIIRGLRDSADFNYELTQRTYNKHLAKDLAGGYLNTVFFVTNKTQVSSSIIRNLAGILEKDEFGCAVKDKLNLDPSNAIEREFLGKLWKAYK